MNRWLIAGAAFVGIFVASAAFKSRSRSHSRLPAMTPLVANSAKKAVEKPLPQDAIVINASENAEIAAPFKLVEDKSAITGMALHLPKGAKTDAHAGRAKWSVSASATATFSAWARVKWKDTCSNSISIKIGDQLEQTVGNDNLFNTWHWIPAGKHTLAVGTNVLTIVEREDGVSADQILFTQDAAYRPVGPVTKRGELNELRRFADDFYRSPGHGLGDWDVASGHWEIGFTFDPNRVHDQYALRGNASQKSASVVSKTGSWNGGRLRFVLLPREKGFCGATLDQNEQGALRVGFNVTGDKCELVVQNFGETLNVPIQSRIGVNQWSQIEIERWAWILKVSVDDREVYAATNLPARAGKVGLFVESGSAAFDDVELSEIAWQADDGKDLTIPWKMGEGAEWFRDGDDPATGVLIGKAGTISASLRNLPVSEVYLLNPDSSPVSVEKMETAHKSNTKEGQLFTASKELLTEATFGFKTSDSGKSPRLERVAIKYGAPQLEMYSMGVYHFTENEVEDASDYLDFTPEEYKAMAKSPEAAKLKRVAKFKPLVGDWSEDESPWTRESGNWRVRNGILDCSGKGAVRHSEEVVGDVDLRMKVSLADAKSAAGVNLYSTPDPGVKILFTPEEKKSDSAMQLVIPADGKWHEALISVRGNSLAASVDNGNVQRFEIQDHTCGRLYLWASSGRVNFDDVEVSFPRKGTNGFNYTFQKREPDWWRQGEWVDHGGIACVLASSWVSLVALNSDGILWNKREFQPNVEVAFTTEENSEWYGWDKYPNHTHFPIDNIRVILATEEDAKLGYWLDVNAEQRTATVLYKKGKPVAKVSQQTNNFPIRYVGGHAPYAPRRNRIALVKTADNIRVLINGRQILTYEDKEPLPVKRVGLAGYRTRINFSHVEIRNLP